MAGYRVIFTFIFMVITTVLASLASENQPSSSLIPVDYEIEDVRNFVQDFNAYTSSYPEGSLGKTCKNSLLSEFKLKYYAPWISRTAISDIDGALAEMKDLLKKEWYGENKRRLPRNLLEELSINCNIEHMPSMRRLAIATAATDVRFLPTTKPFYKNVENFPFDEIQNTALKLNEPIKVLHISRDGLWVFVETADTNGWIQTRDVGFIDKKMARKWMKKAQIVIVKDFTLIHDKSGLVAQKAKVGTICPIDGYDGVDYVVSVAVKAGMHNARVIRAIVPKKAASRFPLEFNTKLIALIGNELINQPYGWGELFQNRDCSAMIRDFYLPFGIWQPRGSSNQISYTRNIPLAGMSGIDKERIINEKGVPFLSLVHLDGHIMLYVGKKNDKALMFQNIWGVRVRNEQGVEYKQVIGKSIISTLIPGSELNLATNSILERVDSMVILRDRCTSIDQ